MISNNPSRYNDLKVLNSSRISEAPYTQPLSLTCGKLPRPQSQPVQHRVCVQGALKIEPRVRARAFPLCIDKKTIERALLLLHSL